MKVISLCFALLVFAFPVFGQSPTIQQYLNIRSASAPTLSPDAKRLFYLSNVTGTSQIYLIDLPNGAPKQITDYEDNIGFVKFSPKGGSVVFGKAKGGDENTQLFWMKADGTNIKELTANPKVRYNFGDWSDDGTKIYYASNKRDKNFFDVYSMNLADGTEKLILQQDGSNDFVAASKNGGKIIVSRSGTELSLDNNLYLIDAATKKETLLTAHTGAAEFGNAAFLKDDLIVMTANDGGEFANLELRDLTRNKTLPFEPTDWDIENLEVSSQNNGFAYTKNREGFSELIVADPRTYKEKNGVMTVTAPGYITKIPLPGKGVVGGLSFSRDQQKIVFTFNGSKFNSDIWLYDFAAQKLMQITNSDRAGIDSNSFVEPQLVKFKSFDGREIPAWYYLPKPFSGMYNYADGGESFEILVTAKKGDKINKPSIPVLISVHGGPEGQERPVFNPLYQYYLSKGYAILATNVRGSTGYGKSYTHLDDVYKREDSIKDLAAAAEWLKTSGGADAKHIGIMGGSYGGYATLAAITLYPDLWAAAVDTVGIANWESYFKNTSGYRKRQREVEYGMADKDAEFLRSISPINKADKIKTPLFVVAGKNDPRVPYTEAEQIVKAVKDKGGIVEYKLYDDEGHGVSKLKNRLDLYPRIADFLDKYMKQ